MMNATILYTMLDSCPAQRQAPVAPLIVTHVGVSVFAFCNPSCNHMVNQIVYKQILGPKKQG